MYVFSKDNNEKIPYVWVDSEKTLDGVTINAFNNKITQIKTNYKNLTIRCKDLGTVTVLSNVKLINVVIEDNGIALSVICMDDEDRFYKKPYCAFFRKAEILELSSIEDNDIMNLHIEVKSDYEITLTEIESKEA